MKAWVLGILVMSLMLVACGEREQVAEVLVSPTFVGVVVDTAVSTTTPTSKPTTEPTTTQEPTAVVTETPTTYSTPTPIPTSTPLVPTPNPEKNYELAEWTPERADQLITELQKLPDTLHDYDRGYHDTLYHEIPRYAAFAQLEALSRFSTSQYVSNWQWDRAYNLAVSNLFNNEPVVEIYANLLQTALNDGLANSETIVLWFENQEPRFEYRVYSVPPPDGYIGSIILEIADGWSGGYIWVLETSSSYETYPLNSAWDFGFAHSSHVELLLEDVTNDGIPEAFTRHFHQPGTIGFLVDTLDIFDLSQVPPSRVYFHTRPPFLGQSAFSSLSVVNDANDNRLIQLDIPVDASYCEASTIQNYQWDGESLVLVNGIYPNLTEQFQLERIESLPDCAAYAFKQVVAGAEAGDSGALEQLENLLPEWPIREPDTSYLELDEFDNYDTREKLQFLVGLLYALNGNGEPARLHLEEIISSSTNPESQWVEPAKLFLTVYHDEDDLVAACMVAQICHEFFSAEILTNLFDGEQFEEANTDSSNVQPFDMKILEIMIADLSETQDKQFADDLIESLKEWPEFDDECEDDTSPLGHQCQNIYLSQYVTGLAYELTGEEEEAMQVYYELWQNHPNSPYAMMARAKLQEVGE